MVLSFLWLFEAITENYKIEPTIELYNHQTIQP
jgi:hypothetical protein